MTPKEIERAFEILWTKVETLNERTKKHTIDIKTIERRIKELEKAKVSPSQKTGVNK